MEDAITVVAEPRSQVVNLDRRTMARADSDAGRRVLLGLLGRCWKELRVPASFYWWHTTQRPLPYRSSSGAVLFGKEHGHPAIERNNRA